MITANYMTNAYGIRREFLEDGINSFCLGALDAPAQIAAGSYERVQAITISDYEYPLPTTISREAR